MPLLAIVAFAGLPSCASFTPVKSPPPEAMHPAIDFAAGDERLRLWREDIDTCERWLLERHAGVDVFASRDQLRDCFERLRSDLPTLRDDQIVVRLQSITTSIGSAHTGIWPSRGALVPRRLPISVRCLSDGVLVTATDDESAALRGGQAMRIEGTDIAEVLAAIATITPHENEWYLRSEGARTIVQAETLRGLGIVSDAGRVPVTVRHADGSEITLVVRPREHGESWALVGAVPAGTAPFSLGPRPGGRAHGSKRLSDSDLLYVWYDRCADDGDHTVSAFGRAVLREIDETKPRAVVFDLRRNGGGNSGLLRPLIDGFADRSINAPNRLFVLIGPATFSSAGLNAEEFRRATRATLVGEPTGQRPHSWMEVRYDWLPNSLMQLNYMLVAPEFRPGSPVAVMPDELVKGRIDDARAGRDAALDRAVELSAGSRRAPAAP